MLATLAFFRLTLRFRVFEASLKTTADPRLIVSLTTFPHRVTTVWATIETIFRQSHGPDMVLLVLAESQFPGRRIPRRLEAQQKRGLRILWWHEDIVCHKKYLPAFLKFPSASIITVDDDFLYCPDMIKGLLDASDNNPGHIVGHRGWNPQSSVNGVAPYDSWIKAGPAGPSSLPEEVFLTHGGGVLYPANLVDRGLVVDSALALSLCPSSDDIWLWAVALKSGVPRFCTGYEFGVPNGAEELSPNLFSRNQHENDSQIVAVLSYFFQSTDFPPAGH